MRVRYWACLVATLVAAFVISRAQESPGIGQGDVHQLLRVLSRQRRPRRWSGRQRLEATSADLTTLAKRNGGKYPADKVTSILRGQTSLMGHGDQQMPVWGLVFWRMSQGHEEQVEMRSGNLNRYLKSLQEK